VPDWDNTESRESDEDATWRDLVARFETPTTTAGPVPWPDREDVPRPRPQTAHGADGADGSPGARGTSTSPAAPVPGGPGEDDPGTQSDGLGTQGPREDGDARGTRGVEGIRGFDDEGVRGAFDADAIPGAHAPDVIQGARERRAAAHSTRARRIRARRAPLRPAPQDEDEHFVPPPPPPLPKLDPVTKGAWAALFGGPGYLVVATAAGWSVPGIAAFCAVAAFITGFAILVLRMNDPGSGGPDDDDDGAVV
jgi:hypothetical protein